MTSAGFFDLEELVYIKKSAFFLFHVKGVF